jgi:hypothetical protein
MSEPIREENRQLAADPHLVTAAFVQAWENIRHIRNERIWFTNAYTAVVAGGLALTQRDGGAASSYPMVPTMGLTVLLLFSFASLLSSIRLVAELRNSIASLRHTINETGMDPIVGFIEPPGGFAARLPLRWVFPVFYGLTTAALVVLLVLQLVR